MANVNIIEVVPDIAQIVRRCPTSTIIRSYARAAHLFFRQSRWWRVNITGATIIGTQVYSLGSDPYVDIVGIKAMDGYFNSGGQPSYFPLSPSDPGTWNPSFEPQQPLTYTYVPEAQFALFPIPNMVYNLTVTAQCAPKRTATQIEETLLTKWSEALDAGALSYLFAIPRQPWSSPQEALRNAVTFQAAINAAKADEQRNFNTGTVMAKRRPFTV